MSSSIKKKAEVDEITGRENINKRIGLGTKYLRASLPKSD
jgi:hypothetical protein